MKYTSPYSVIEIIRDYANSNPVLNELKQYIKAHLANECAQKPKRDLILASLDTEIVGAGKTKARYLGQVRRWIELCAPVPEYEIRGCYAGEWEAVTAEPTYSLAKGQLKCYRENERGTSFIIKQQTEFLYGKQD